MRPIDGDAPAGSDLRLDASPQSIYFRLRDARAEARAAERQADNDPASRGAVPPQWTAVRELATEALIVHSKDVEIACWLTEALTRRDGLAGLADGAEVLAGLIGRFWGEGLFPSSDDTEPEARLIAVTGMSGQDREGSLLQPLRKVVLFTRTDGTPVTVWDYERARELAALGDQADPAARAAVESMSFVELEAEARGPGCGSLAVVGHNVTRALTAWQALEATMADVAVGDAAPATGRVHALLERLQALVQRYIPAGADAADADGAAEPASSPAAAAAAPELGVATAPASRDALLQQILHISAAFRVNEPNSPLSFTLEEAVRRARMSWPELLRELLPDVAARSVVISGAGLRPLED